MSSYRPSDSRTARSAEEVPCIHCGLPVPRGGIDPGSSEQFCCSGCRLVYEAIRGCGLQRYYALRETGETELAQKATELARRLDPTAKA